jgi:hypothetical protein
LDVRYNQQHEDRNRHGEFGQQQNFNRSDCSLLPSLYLDQTEGHRSARAAESVALLAFAFTRWPSASLDINDVGVEELVETVLAVSAADTAPPPSRVETLHGLEVLPVDVGFAKNGFPGRPSGRH